MALISTIHGQQHIIDTSANGPQRQVTLDSTSREIDWRQIAPLVGSAAGGRYSLLLGGRSYELTALLLDRPDETRGQVWEILLAGRRYEVLVEDERERGLRGSLK